MSRQHAAPILSAPAGPAKAPRPADAEWSEDHIQRLVHNHPECLPIREVDPVFASVGGAAIDKLLEDERGVLDELGGTAGVDAQRDGRRLVIDKLTTGAWTIPSEREKAISWLAARTNDSVNVLRPRIEAAAHDPGDT